MKKRRGLMGKRKIICNRTGEKIDKDTCIQERDGHACPYFKVCW